MIGLSFLIILMFVGYSFRHRLKADGYWQVASPLKGLVIADELRWLPAPSGR